MSKHADEEDETQADDHRAIINFSTTSYAVLERDQRVDVENSTSRTSRRRRSLQVSKHISVLLHVDHLSARYTFVY